MTSRSSQLWLPLSCLVPQEVQGGALQSHQLPRRIRRMARPHAGGWAGTASSCALVCGANFRWTQGGATPDKWEGLLRPASGLPHEKPMHPQTHHVPPRCWSAPGLLRHGGVRCGDDHRHCELTYWAGSLGDRAQQDDSPRRGLIVGCLAFHTSTWLPHGNVETHVSRGAHPHQCPCYYPGNYASNKRWCCGDMYHLDMSAWAFEKLAEKRWGVIAIEWRDVSCSHRPAKPAVKPGAFGGPTDMPVSYKPRPGWSRWMDKRIARLVANNGAR